jgi:hypothetical protein
MRAQADADTFMPLPPPDSCMASHARCRERAA